VAEILTLTLGTSLFAMGCGLDHKKLEDSITSECKTKNLVLKSVECPKDRPIKQGDKFDCSGVSEAGDKLVFHVTQDDDKGNIKWELDGKIIELKAFSEELKKQLHGAEVTCPAKTLVVKKDSTFDCEMKGEGGAHPLTVTFKDNEGNYSTKAK
jgi:hypothetical protein